MADEFSRKLSFPDGGRPYNNKDFEELQKRVELNAIEFVKHYGTEGILSGCQSKGQSGYVFLGNEVRRVPRDTSFDALPDPPTQFYWIVTEEVSEERIFADENNKEAFVVYKAKWITGVADPPAPFLRFTLANDYINNKFEEKAYIKSIATDNGLVTGNTILTGANGVSVQNVNNTITISTPVSAGGDISFGGSGNPANTIAQFTNATTIIDTNMSRSGSNFTVTDGTFGIVSATAKKLFTGSAAATSIGLQYVSNIGTLYINDTTPSIFNIQQANLANTSLSFTTTGVATFGYNLLTKGNIGFSNGITAAESAIRDGGTGDLIINAGKTTIVGGGTSASTVFDTAGGIISPHDTHLYLTADKEIHLITNIQTFASRKELIIDTTGNLTLPSAAIGTAADWIATSDKRLKYNIVSLDSELDNVAAVGKLAVKYVRFADDKKKERIGFIAQDIEKYYPEFIEKGQDDMLGISYAKMVAPLYKAVSELKDIIQQQQQEIDILKKR